MTNPNGKKHIKCDTNMRTYWLLILPRISRFCCPGKLTTLSHWIGNMTRSKASIHTQPELTAIHSLATTCAKSNLTLPKGPCKAGRSSHVITKYGKSLSFQIGGPRSQPTWCISTSHGPTGHSTVAGQRRNRRGPRISQLIEKVNWRKNQHGNSHV